MNNGKIISKVKLDMSIQENASKYYIEMVELYAKRHNISIDETFNLFTKHLVYENIISQSDIWGHYMFEENLDFIENELLNKEKRQMLVYHGSVFDFEDIDLNKSLGYRDFGNGFYTTVLYSQALAWGQRNAKRSHNDKAYVYTFMYNFYNNDDLNVKEFSSCNKDWLDFVLSNRKSKALVHDYDVVIGPVADDDINETITLLQANQISEDYALERISFRKTSNQIVFHTPKALKSLILTDKENK